MLQLNVVDFNFFFNLMSRYVREAGGVCIADEVLTGLGRTGENHWAFQAHRKNRKITAN